MIQHAGIVISEAGSRIFNPDLVLVSEWSEVATWMEIFSVQHWETLSVAGNIGSSLAGASAAAAMPQLSVPSCLSMTSAAVSCHWGEDCHGSWSRCYGLVTGDIGMESNQGRRTGMLRSA